MELILLGDLNAQLWEPQDSKEGDLVRSLVDIGLVDMTAHFLPRRHYRGVRLWVWNMRLEGRQLTARGD